MAPKRARRLATSRKYFHAHIVEENESLKFGIGCFYFTERPGQNLSWKEAVAESLASLERVSDVQFNLGILLEQEAKSGPGFYPTRGMLMFRLHVPREEQSELNNVLRYLPAGAEHFVIMMYFRYYEAVAFVQTESSADANPFSSVLVVREYLERAFATRDLPAEMHIVGPTPFHVDLHVKPATVEHEFELVRARGKGREEFTFLYSRASFSSPQIAAVTLFERISEELSVYYSLLSAQEDRQRERTEVLVLVQNLINIYQATGLKARMRRMLTSSTKIRRVVLKAVNAEYQSQDDETTSRSRMDELYSEGVEPYFKDFLESEVSAYRTSTLLAAKEIVSVLDQARQRQIEVTSLFFSAIAGGLAGALVSLLVH